MVVHQAGSSTEAVVIRGLLESAGISSPGSAGSDPFPMREPPEGFRDSDIVVLESQAEEARAVIASYLSSSDGIQIEESGPSADSEDPSAA
ncbi:MAG: hypothetical protein M1453_15165 [Acidobacteria bacterium]|nr:hypothetical protein [Acidobacteriota bacterium]MCL5289321.1 hypothetical protein [Acidobacteriota bacterium]